MASIKDQPMALQGVNKAAAFVLSLSEDYVGKVLGMLEDDEMVELSSAMATLGKVESDLIESLYAEFIENISGASSIVGSIDKTERLLSKFLSQDRVDTILEELRGPAGRNLWEKLGNVNELFLANYLKNEYPQTVAVVLSKIKAENAARILPLLPAHFALDVVLRMLRMEPIPKDILNDVERTLKVEFMSNLAKTSRRDPHEVVAEIFNYMDRKTEGQFMENLEQKNGESAEKVKALMFTFDDLIKINNAGIQAVIRVIDKSKLALALKGAADSIKELFFRNMSERSTKLLKDDMEGLGMVRLKDVDEAQSSIVSAAKELANKGEIEISNEKEKDVMIG